jgi:hypothetical protein
MSHHTSRVAAALVLAAALACSDRTPGTAPATSAAPGVSNPPPTPAPGGAPRAELLARSFALALGDPAFRAHVKAELDRSPFREHKLQFQRFLAGAGGGHALSTMARRSGLAQADLAHAAADAIPLEMYLPVPAHRRDWKGGENVLVATANADHDVPVAFDVHGNRQLLDPEHPPAIPVIAVVPVETDFSASPSQVICLMSCGGGGGGGGVADPLPPPAPGLYMTKAHFVDDFEGWLKGSPEFEVHILGQKGQSDSLTDYQCAGEKQPAPYYFDQNDLDWSGSVLLFSKSQLDAYNAAHPGKNVRVFVVEDDDTACDIKANRDLIGGLLKAVDDANKSLTAGNDSSKFLSPSTVIKAYKRGTALQKLWAAIAAFFNTNDELVGNAVEDVVVGTTYPGYNWIVKGDNNVTNGWIQLEMK